VDNSTKRAVAIASFALSAAPEPGAAAYPLTFHYASGTTNDFIKARLKREADGTCTLEIVTTPRRRAGGRPPSATVRASNWESWKSIYRRSSSVIADRAPFDAGEPLVQEVLREYGDLARRQVRQYLPKSEPATYLYDLVADYPGRGGKMLRPCLCIAAAKAFGASAEDAMASAASIEFPQRPSSIHDDIQDGSDQRRGSTLHSSHGAPPALNAATHPRPEFSSAQRQRPSPGPDAGHAHLRGI
jgi:hypothetical protein